MTVEKTSAADCERLAPEQQANAIIEDQRAATQENLGGHHQLISTIEALFGGEEARHEALASIPADQLEHLQQMIGRDKQGSLYETIIRKRNEAFAKQIETLGFEVKILHAGTTRGVFLIKRDGVSEEELFGKISPVAHNLKIEARLTTTRIPYAGGGILVAFEDPNTN